ncbi:hypothetical protein GE09DRAFT_239324 [Coniochaeta sp. 2T2.1]|nr:hypothetical protein GE09DRAFT_239324 [Coniochaeta sp. 2T2.1]
MEYSAMPPPLPQQLSYAATVQYNLVGIGGVAGDPTPDFAQGSSGSQTSHITLLAPRGNTEVPSSPPSTRLTSQTLLPEVIASADLISDAQPALEDVVREVSANEVTLPRHTQHQPASGEAALASAEPMPSRTIPSKGVAVSLSAEEEEAAIMEVDNDCNYHPLLAATSPARFTTCLSDLPNETSRRLRDLSLAPILHAYRLRRTRSILPPMLWSPFRPSLADLIRRSIFLTRTTVVSRKLARSLVCIRLSRRLAARPSVEALVARSVLPPECLPTKKAAVAPALVAKKRAVERERVKDGLRRWVERVWRGEVKERSEGVKQWEEKVGVGRVWRLRRFWENVGGNRGGGDNR